jgi:hypothetical protein
MRCFHDLHIVGMDSNLTCLLIIQSMYLDLAGRILVSWNWLRCPKFILSPATADLSVVKLDVPCASAL